MKANSARLLLRRAKNKAAWVFLKMRWRFVKNKTIFRAAAITCIMVASGALAATTVQRPNVLLILADDMGYSDIGCYGGEAITPNLDSLAESGVRFTQFYNGARCCPTRASLLTGLYAHQTGVGHMTHNDRQLPGYRADLNNRCVTMAEVLGDSGYRTYMVGKWHVTRHEKPEGPKHNWPLQRGFEKYYGIIWGSTSFFDPAICRGNTWYSRESDPEYKSDNYYLTDALTDNAITFLQQHQKESPQKPFFLYAAYTAAHWPMHALEKDIGKYKGRFDAGYDKLRQQRVERLRKMGMMRPEWEVAPTAANWEQVKNREWELRCMEVYAAMIDSMDQGIGRIIAELKRQNQFDNTLILFLQDNGACAEEVGREPRKRDPNEKLRSLRPEELPVGGRQPGQTRDGRPVKRGPEILPGGADSYIAYGEAWANVSNTPFREYKHWVHEGGIATPLIAHWPAGIAKERASKLVNDPSHVIDIMATCIDVAGTTYPAKRKEQQVTAMEGISLRSALNGKTLHRPAPLFWEHEGNRAVRDGKWKLVAKENQPWELYDMEADRTEMHNIAAENEGIVQRLEAQWDAWAKRADVAPLGGYKMEPKRNAGGKSILKLQAASVIPDGQAPQVHDRALTITVELRQPKGDGVLVAQGGSAHGYAFFVRDGKLALSVRRDGKLSTMQADRPLADSPTTVVAVLLPDGSAELRAGDKLIGKSSDIGPLGRTPRDGLSAGHDSDDPVEVYAEQSKYTGGLGEITLETGRAN